MFIKSLNARRAAVVLLVLAAALAVFVWLVRRQAPDPAAARGGRFGLGAPMAVNVATARSGDIPVQLMALGTVTPLNTATVKTQVSGQLQQIAFKEGQLVRAGDFLAQVDPRPFQNSLAQAEGVLARDEAQLANARLDAKRYADLLAQDSVSEQQVATQKALVDQLAGTVATDRAQVATARLNLQYAHVTAPVGGRVGLRQVDVGNYVTAGDANGIVIITQQQPISTIFTLPEDRVPALMRRLKSGDTLRVEAWDRSNTKLLATGVLQTVDNQLDTSTGTLKLRAQFGNEDSQLFPNQFINVRLLLETLQGQVIVPAAAIQKGSVNGVPGSFVYKVDADSNTVSVQPVKTGVADGEQIAIMEGIAPGDIVVTEGGDRLRDGAKVQLPNADPSRAGAGGGRQFKGPRGDGKGPRGEGKGPRGDGKRGEGKGGEGRRPRRDGGNGG